MYIRRKVFSVAYDENGEERLFSTTEIMSEEAYVEKLYAEAEESDDETLVTKGQAKKAAKVAGITTAGVAAGGAAAVAGGKLIGKHLRKKAAELDPKYWGENLGKGPKGEEVKKLIKKAEKFEKPYEKVAEVFGKTKNAVKNLPANVKEQINKGLAKLEKTKAGTFVVDQQGKILATIEKNPKTMKGLKIGGGVAAGLALAGGAAYAGKKYAEKKAAKK